MLRLVEEERLKQEDEEEASLLWGVVQVIMGAGAVAGAPAAGVGAATGSAAIPGLAPVAPYLGWTVGASAVTTGVALIANGLGEIWDAVTQGSDGGNDDSGDDSGDGSSDDAPYDPNG